MSHYGDIAIFENKSISKKIRHNLHTLTEIFIFSQLLKVDQFNRSGDTPTRKMLTICKKKKKSKRKIVRETIFTFYLFHILLLQ